jgi:hypothetical protein
LSTSSNIGAGKIYGIALIAMAIICFLMIIIIFFADKMKSLKNYDIDSLKWD